MANRLAHSGTAAIPLLRLATVLGLLGAAGPVHAWVYPEHRDIALLAAQDLDPERKATFDRLWQDARAGDEDRLCAQGADTAQGLVPQCIDWAALSGIAGDHSCSSAEMLETVRSSDWILTVADVAAQLKVDLSRIPVTAPVEEGGVRGAQRRLASAVSRAERQNALRTADTRLQRADPQYALRADSNLAHFMLARPDTNLDPHTYAKLALKPGSDVNAAGVYIWFHISALQKASRLAGEQLTPRERRALTRAALFDEAFALHFLEDMYASGHVAGSWGDVSQRKGTHDFYNENGLEVFTWKGRDHTTVLMGDAHMRPQDAELAAEAVRISLEQVLDEATGHSRGYAVPYAPDAPGEPDPFDICKTGSFPDRGLGVGSGGKSVYASTANETLLDTPVPGLGPGLGALPRTRSEIGTFFGLAGGIDLRTIDGGFVPSETSPGAIGGLDVGFRAGLGLEGALGDSGDGLVFAQVGYRAETPSSNRAEGSVLGATSHFSNIGPIAHSRATRARRSSSNCSWVRTFRTANRSTLRRERPPWASAPCTRWACVGCSTGATIWVRAASSGPGRSGSTSPGPRHDGPASSVSARSSPALPRASRRVYRGLIPHPARLPARISARTSAHTKRGSRPETARLTVGESRRMPHRRDSDAGRAGEIRQSRWRVRWLFVLAFLASLTPATGARSAEVEPPEAPPESQPREEYSTNVVYDIQNPFAFIPRLPLENQFDFGSGPEDALTYSLRPRPVIPFRLTDDLALISRTTFNLVYQEGLAPGDENEFGLADTDMELYVSPRKALAGGTLILAAGPIVRFDTSTSRILGGNKWGIGPAVAAILQPARVDATSGWTFSLLANQLFGFANGDNGELNATFLQPTASYTFETGTSLGLDTQSTYDWHIGRWLVPINLTISQLVQPFGQDVVATVGGRYFAETPSDGPDWGAQLSFNFLFPSQ